LRVLSEEGGKGSEKKKGKKKESHPSKAAGVIEPQKGLKAEVAEGSAQRLGGGRRS